MVKKNCDKSARLWGLIRVLGQSFKRGPSRGPPSDGSRVLLRTRLKGPVMTYC